METLHVLLLPLSYTAGGVAVSVATTRMAIAYWAFRRKGVPAKYRSEILREIGRLFKFGD
ncbi:hypothetical protein [Nocardia sp. NBC_01327]|uniref:hypothetical protein n=1 Tax=Nocardia sp. NBC_01327 TaxID=2903593 RepID=UPI002E0E0B4E|nr:hypothetical protein OG326_15190 [Nocardia sp. NBC_01327]